jgi:hypothetical protein
VVGRRNLIRDVEFEAAFERPLNRPLPAIDPLSLPEADGDRYRHSPCGRALRPRSRPHPSSIASSRSFHRRQARIRRARPAFPASISSRCHLLRLRGKADHGDAGRDGRAPGVGRGVDPKDVGHPVDPTQVRGEIFQSAPTMGLLRRPQCTRWRRIELVDDSVALAMICHATSLGEARLRAAFFASPVRVWKQRNKSLMNAVSFYQGRHNASRSAAAHSQ